LGPGFVDVLLMNIDISDAHNSATACSEIYDLFILQRYRLDFSNHFSLHQFSSPLNTDGKIIGGTASPGAYMGF